MKTQLSQKRLGYLSGAPRVATHLDAESAGARAHVLGTIHGFKELDWDVKPFIVGDRVPQTMVMQGSEKVLNSGLVANIAADLVRLGMSAVNSQRSSQELGHQVDWVYERFATLQSLGPAFKRQGIPWILETNGPFFYEAKAERKSLALTQLARWVEIKAYRDCDVLVCISQALKDIVVSEAKISPEKVLIVPNGVDTSFFDPAQHQPKRHFDGFTIGFVGGLLAWQGLDLLLDAIYDLRLEGLDISLAVLGDGLMRPIWEAQAQRLGIAQNVTFMGRKSWQDIPSAIAGFDVGYSGQVELKMGKMYHSPLKLYEYMAMGKPVIASAFEDAKRAVSENTGFLFQAGNKEDLKRALSKAYDVRASLDEMGRKARAEIVAQHSWTSRVATMVDQVQRILLQQASIKSSTVELARFLKPS